MTSPELKERDSSDGGGDAPPSERPQWLARLFLPFLLLAVVWITLGSIPQMAQQAIAQVTFTERCPEESDALRAALADTGVQGVDLSVLEPLGYPGNKGDAYVVARADCTLERAVLPTPATAEDARSALLENGWQVSEGKPGLFNATKSLNGVTYTVGYPLAEPGDTVRVIVRSEPDAAAS